MSTDFGFYCHDCMERLEGVASSSIAYGFKVRAPMVDVDAFLSKHVGHHIIIQNDDVIDDIIEELLAPGREEPA